MSLILASMCFFIKKNKYSWRDMQVISVIIALTHLDLYL